MKHIYVHNHEVYKRALEAYESKIQTIERVTTIEEAWELYKDWSVNKDKYFKMPLVVSSKIDLAFKTPSNTHDLYDLIKKQEKRVKEAQKDYEKALKSGYEVLIESSGDVLEICLGTLLAYEDDFILRSRQEAENRKIEEGLDSYSKERRDSAYNYIRKETGSAPWPYQLLDRLKKEDEEAEQREKERLEQERLESERIHKERLHEAICRKIKKEKKAKLKQTIKSFFKS